MVWSLFAGARSATILFLLLEEGWHAASNKNIISEK
jgi:hypothetical protein